MGAGTCYAGGLANAPGAEDPFYVNAWHLKNTGPTQVISAVNSNGLAGIDANVETVHKAGLGCTGKGVTISVVDSGLEIGHEDLVTNVLTGKSFNFANNTSDPSPGPNQTSVDHGTGVAGIAAARGWNGKGSRGTAPLASLVGYTTGATTGDTDQSTQTYLMFGARVLADAVKSVVALFGTRADGVGVFNYSAGADFSAPSTINDTAESELAAKYGTTSLRGGLGAVYFQSAGNSFTDLNGTMPDGSTLKTNCPSVLAADAATLGGTLSFIGGMTCGQSNQENVNKPYFYQVASMGITGVASSYSTSGAANWISGFGGEYGVQDAAIITTDNSSCSSGTNNTANKAGLVSQIGEAISKLVADLFGTSTDDPNCNYTGQMNGTSAASPSIAGVAALLLEANSKLTWQDVGYIMAKTARKVDTGIASGAKKVTFTPTGGSTAWNLDDPWLTNAADYNFQNRYGFGMVDSDAAVRLAVAYTAPTGRRAAAIVATGGASATSKVETVGQNVASVAFASPGAVTGQLRLDLTLTNNTGADINPGMLQFIVENTATGTKSIVMPAFTSYYVGGKKFPIKAGAQQAHRMSTNAFYGEALGTYKVTVVDFSGASGATGKTLDFTPKLTSYSM